MCFDQHANFRWKITLYLLYNIQRGNNVFLNMISRYNIYLFGINIISKIQNNWLKNAAGRNKKPFQHYPRLDISGGTCVMFTRENNGDLWARPQTKFPRTNSGVSLSFRTGETLTTYSGEKLGVLGQADVKVDYDGQYCQLWLWTWVTNLHC